MSIPNMMFQLARKEGGRKGGGAMRKFHFKCVFYDKALFYMQNTMSKIVIPNRCTAAAASRK